MKNFKIFVLVIAFPLLSFTSMHKYYVSVTEVEYVKEQKSVQIITRIFIDDFEKLLRERYDKDITLAIENEKTTVDYYTEKYLKDKFKININEQEVEFKFLGKEYEEDIMVNYLEIENVEDISSIHVVNRILFDVFPDQQNIVRLKINTKNKSFLLTKENDKRMLIF